MSIEICKWKNNCDSPVLFMIDDLANVWVDLTGNGQVELGEDWGYAKRGNNSSIVFLEDNILKKFPSVKVNFYVPVGIRAGMIAKSSISMYSNSIDENDEVKSFFRKLHEHPNYELSYHGTTHGLAKSNTNDFLQEWECFSSLSDAIDTINKGRKIFKNAIGEFPKGGKYCGYKAGKYGDQSVISTGFLWWNRYWNKGIETNEKQTDIGSELNLKYAYDVTRIGNSKVIDIPSTLAGNIFNNHSKDKFKRLIKFLLWPYIFRRRAKAIDFLLNNNLVISIQEHISPARNDGKIQTPNIFTDKKSLLHIFRYLSKKNVWYCTGSELAEYYILRNEVKVLVKQDRVFNLIFDKSELPFKLNNKELTLKINSPFTAIVQPDGDIIPIIRQIASIKVMSGDFLLKY